MSSYVLPLDEIAEGDLERAGAKAFNLAVLLRKGFLTPGGFVVTSEALDAFLAANNLDRKLGSLATCKAADPRVALEQGRFARKLFDEARWPLSLSSEVKNGVQELLRKARLDEASLVLAVRSSFAGEDGLTSSFAGQMATVLDVRGEESLLRAIVRCWTSLWSSQALSYRAIRGRTTEVSGGVLVQVQLDPEWAGVAVAADALGGREEILVEAVRSIGKTVVSGSADPHRLIIGQDAAKDEAPKVLSHTPSSIEPAMPQEVRDMLARSTARLFEKASGFGDFEWALKENKFFVLQARPLTTSESSWEQPKDGILWSRVLGEEFWSGPVTPLMFSFVGPVIEEAMIRRPISMVNAALCQDPYLRLIYDHVFVNLNSLRPIIQMIPSWALTDEVLKMFPPDERILIRQNAGVVLPMDLPMGVVRFTRKGAPWWFGHAAKRFASFAGTQIPKVMEFEPPEPDAPSWRFMESAYWLMDLMDQYLETTVWGITYAYIFVPLAKRLIETWFPASLSQQLVRMALSNLPSDRNLTTSREMADLARLLKDTDAFEQISSEKLDHRSAKPLLVRTAKGKRFLDEFFRLLRTCGHRAVERDIMATRWADDPQIPFTLILKLANDVIPPTRKPASDQEVIRTLCDALPQGRRTLLQPIKAPAVKMAVKLARQFLPIRENMRFYADVFLHALRKLALSRAEGLVRTGVLDADSQKLVFFLPHEQLFSESLFTRSARADAMLSTARRRMEHFHLHRHRSLPLYVRDGRDYEAQLDGAVGETMLCGLPASPGLGRGRVRRAERYEDFLDFKPGEVLVVPYLDPSWSSLLYQAKGVVTEVGGQLSHGAIVAREVEVPAVVGVSGAMKALSNGQEVIVDGHKGFVRILS